MSNWFHEFQLWIVNRTEEGRVTQSHNVCICNRQVAGSPQGLMHDCLPHGRLTEPDPVEITCKSLASYKKLFFLISSSGGRNLTLHDYHMKFPGNGSLLKTVDLSTKRPSSWHLFAPTRSHVKEQKGGHRRKKTEE